DGFAALDQEFPKCVGVTDSAGESATDSDDSNVAFNVVFIRLNQRVLSAHFTNDPRQTLSIRRVPRFRHRNKSLSKNHEKAKEKLHKLGKFGAWCGKLGTEQSEPYPSDAFAWLGRYLRLANDYECKTQHLRLPFR